MHLALVIPGVLLIALVFLDLFWSTMGVGGGPLSKRLTAALWRSFLGLHRRRRRSARLFSFAGVIITLLTLLTWILLLWAGWTLVFCGAEQAVIRAETERPASFWDRVYFTGYTISTLGLGDYIPQGQVWEILTSVASLTGLSLITLSITFLVPLGQAATQKRQLAAQIAGLGETADAILLRTWNGSDFQVLGRHLTASLTTELAKLEQRHLTYPSLHYFHSQDASKAAALRLAALDEALTILEHGVDEGFLLNRGTFYPARRTITSFLDTLATAFIEPTEEAPPPPSLDPLREQGIPVVDEAVFRMRVAQVVDRRRLLLALVENDGWTWDLLRSDEAQGAPLEPAREGERTTS